MADDAVIEEVAPSEGDAPAATPVVEQPVAEPAATEPAVTAPAIPASAEPPEEGKDWRVDLARGDAALEKFLGRYASPDAAIKKLKEFNDDFKAGKYRKPLSEDATDEELAAYRKEIGVPDAPDGYYEALPEGLVVGEDDKPYVGKFMEAMHGKNAPPEVVNAALDSYYAILQEQAEEQAESAREAERAGTDLLREEWGADYRRNLNAVKSHLETLPEAVANAITNGRAPDGTPIGSSAPVIKWLADIALEANPLATVVPGAGSNQAGAIADEIADIEKTMRENRAAYNKNEKMQARYLELIDARLKLDAKG